jgi:hypothetical protein
MPSDKKVGEKKEKRTLLNASNTCDLNLKGKAEA